MHKDNMQRYCPHLILLINLNKISLVYKIHQNYHYSN